MGFVLGWKLLIRVPALAQLSNGAHVNVAVRELLEEREPVVFQERAIEMDRGPSQGRPFCAILCNGVRDP